MCITWLSFFRKKFGTQVQIQKWSLEMCQGTDTAPNNFVHSSHKNWECRGSCVGLHFNPLCVHRNRAERFAVQQNFCLELSFSFLVKLWDQFHCKKLRAHSKETWTRKQHSRLRVIYHMHVLLHITCMFYGSRMHLCEYTHYSSRDLDITDMKSCAWQLYLLITSFCSWKGQDIYVTLCAFRKIFRIKVHI